MTANGALQTAVYLLVLLALVRPLGDYMARAYEGQPILPSRALGWLGSSIGGWTSTRCQYLLPLNDGRAREKAT